ncbi:Pvstp1 [Plasmodium coatneyi]|uniref:Pvstp1 n=1 Tax=Plasmodium coatneyi TaxID=208452 RepID=A0A1B1DTZ0_9APIC|nr:Pvstp1 [Plasmodium coatneyi]ANQ06077.1 Pvstp1 [Plasmodium coatneyi]
MKKILNKLSGAMTNGYTKEQDACKNILHNGNTSPEANKRACQLITEGLRHIYEVSIDEKDNGDGKPQRNKLFKRTMGCLILNIYADMLKNNGQKCDVSKGIEQAFLKSGEIKNTIKDCKSDPPCLQCNREENLTCTIGGQNVKENVKTMLDQKKQEIEKTLKDLCSSSTLTIDPRTCSINGLEENEEGNWDEVFTAFSNNPSDADEGGAYAKWKDMMSVCDYNAKTDTEWSNPEKSFCRVMIRNLIIANEQKFKCEDRSSRGQGKNCVTKCDLLNMWLMYVKDRCINKDVIEYAFEAMYNVEEQLGKGEKDKLCRYGKFSNIVRDSGDVLHTVTSKMACDAKLGKLNNIHNKDWCTERNRIYTRNLIEGVGRSDSKSRENIKGKELIKNLEEKEQKLKDELDKVKVEVQKQQPPQEGTSTCSTPLKDHLDRDTTWWKSTRGNSDEDMWNDIKPRVEDIAKAVSDNNEDVNGYCSGNKWDGGSKKACQLIVKGLKKVYSYTEETTDKDAKNNKDFKSTMACMALNVFAERIKEEKCNVAQDKIEKAFNEGNEIHNNLYSKNGECEKCGWEPNTDVTVASEGLRQKIRGELEKNKEITQTLEKICQDDTIPDTAAPKSAVGPVAPSPTATTCEKKFQDEHNNTSNNDYLATLIKEWVDNQGPCGQGKIWDYIQKIFTDMVDTFPSQERPVNTICAGPNRKDGKPFSNNQKEYCKALLKIILFMNGLTQNIQYRVTNKDRREGVGAYLTCIVGTVTMFELYGEHCWFEEIMKYISEKIGPELQKKNIPDKRGICNSINVKETTIGTQLVGTKIKKWIEEKKEKNDKAINKYQYIMKEGQRMKDCATETVWRTDSKGSSQGSGGWLDVKEIIELKKTINDGGYVTEEGTRKIMEEIREVEKEDNLIEKLKNKIKDQIQKQMKEKERQDTKSGKDSGCSNSGQNIPDIGLQKSGVSIAPGCTSDKDLGQPSEDLIAKYGDNGATTHDANSNTGGNSNDQKDTDGRKPHKPDQSGDTTVAGGVILEDDDKKVPDTQNGVQPQPGHHGSAEDSDPQNSQDPEPKENDVNVPVPTVDLSSPQVEVTTPDKSIPAAGITPQGVGHRGSGQKERLTVPKLPTKKARSTPLAPVPLLSNIDNLPDLLTSYLPTIPVLIGTSVMTYLLWKYLFLGKKRKRHRRAHQVSGPPSLGEQLLDPVDDQDGPYEYTLVKERKPRRRQRRSPGKKPVSRRTIIDIHLEVLDECQKGDLHSTKEDFFVILVQEFMGSEFMGEDFVPEEQLPEVNVPMESVPKEEGVLKEDALKEDVPREGVPKEQLGMEQNFSLENLSSSENEHSPPTCNVPYWINWIEKNKTLLEKCRTQPWFCDLKVSWKEHRKQNHIPTEESKQCFLNDNGDIPSLESHKKELWKQWVAMQHDLMELNSQTDWFIQMLENMEEIPNETEELLGVDKLQSQRLCPESYKQKQFVAKLWMLILALMFEECEREENVHNKELYLDGLLQNI